MSYPDGTPKVDVNALYAEIERLRGEAAHWVDMAAQADVACMAKNDEIERLKIFESRYREEYDIVKRIWEILGFDEFNSNGQPKKSIYEYIQEKDAEIERLKVVVKYQKEALDRWAEADLQSLLISAADALQKYIDYPISMVMSVTLRESGRAALTALREAAK